MIVANLFAGLLLAVCLVLLLRLCLSLPRRRRFDSAVRQATHSAGVKLRRIRHWRADRQQAARAAEEAIQHARRGDWDGNVYTPKSFRNKPRKPH